MGRFGGRLPQLPPKIAAVMANPHKPPSVVNNPPVHTVPVIVVFEDLLLPQRAAQIAGRLAVAHPPTVNNPPFGQKPFSWGWGAPNVTVISNGELIPPTVNNPPFGHKPFDGNWDDWWGD